MTASIEIKDLEFSYSGSQVVLKIPEFSVERGEKVFLHGPSGCGKTTFLGLLSGILVPQSGQISILGTSLESLSLRARDRFRGNELGYIFQMFNLIPYLNVQENVQLPLRMNPKKLQQVQDPAHEIKQILDDLGIGHLREKPVHALSIGQQQRVAAARSLIGKPKLIIADEPTSALDYDSREAFLKLLFQSADRHGSTIIFVSHDHSLANLFPRHTSMLELNQVGRK